MSIFSLAEPAAPSFEAEISAIALQRVTEQQAMIAEAEALLGKLAADATCSPQQAYVPPSHEVPAPKLRRSRKAKRLVANDVDANGYAIHTPETKLNAVGKPYSPQYDPKYRMKYRTPRIGKAPSTAASVNARSAYRAAITEKHSYDAALIEEICARNGA